MNLEPLDHLALRGASLETTRDWSIHPLVFENVHPGHGGGIPIFLRLGTNYLTLLPKKENDPPAKNGQDCQSAQTDLESKSVPFQFRDNEISHSVHFSNPNGFLLEITTYDIQQEGKAP